MVKKRKDIIGQKFDRLTVLEFRRIVNKNSLYLCQCECGTIKEVRYSGLLNKSIKSCGCLRNERVSAAKTIHGMSKTIEYRTHGHIIERCTNPNHPSYSDYGGRGIVICQRWLGPQGFINFLTDMGKRPGPGYSIDRIDNDGNYDPDNCRWATRKEQNNNYRQNLNIEIDGITKNATDWAEIYGISRDVIYCRVQKGWDAKRAVVTPLMKYTKHKKRLSRIHNQT